MIQSSAYAPDELNSRSNAYLSTMPDLLANLPAEQWATLVAGAKSVLEEKPKSIAEKANQMFSLGYDYDGDWERTQETLAALENITQADTAALFASAIDPQTGRRLMTLVSSKKHTPSAESQSFENREDWKKTQTYQ